ncbi:MAG: class I SAM-dependent methyltransferase [Gemmatimonadetes bacterium]|nr:class I SAM-dependent methyltransferase [Gemmatimonadota bacterium]
MTAGREDRDALARDLEPVQATFEDWGREDPLYAVLTRKARRGNRWDPEEFFERGRVEIAEVVAYLGRLGLEVGRGRALDFGCGVGRLTQALADHFDEAVGVDIAASMVERARKLDRHGEKVRYVVNTAPDLAIFGDDTFDFVYSNKVLQHIPPLAVEAYVREFFRVLAPGGVAVFQMRSGPRIEPGTLRARLYTLRRRTLRRLWKRLRGLAPYEMHYLARARMEEVVAEAGATLVDVQDVSGGRAKSFRYCARAGYHSAQ